MRGFTLVELLIALLVCALLATAVAQFSRSMLRGVRVLEVASEAQEAARLGAQLIAGELRDAGFSPDARLGNGIRRAAADAVALVRDLNGDGDSDDASEAVAFQYNAATRTLVRGLGNAPPQPLLNDVPAGGLRFAFFDEAGAPLIASGELSDAQRARIRRIVAQLVVEIGNPNPAEARPIRATQTATVVLRNAPNP
ncbi:MAG: prepilin-type N-terminal cleavage/methylation domain-containing protein [Deltaproteobacteria bacterium]|nr:prepilin-type N-terminal cleavage/methylation domain-containing protein [Deltaproteobacteria bacterium]